MHVYVHIVWVQLSIPEQSRNLGVVLGQNSPPFPEHGDLSPCDAWVESGIQVGMQRVIKDIGFMCTHMH